MNRRTQALLIASVILMAGLPSASAAERQFALGLRGNIIGGTGDPVNDVLGGGLYGRFSLNEKWRIGMAVDTSTEFDVERVSDQVGMPQDPNVDVIDALGSSVSFSAWIERAYGREDKRTEWFWTAGLGINSVDVEDAQGPLADGGEFDITIDAGTEFLLLASAGVRWKLGNHWEVELAGRLDQHFADWTVTERNTLTTGTVDDYLVKGAHIAFAYRF